MRAVRPGCVEGSGPLELRAEEALPPSTEMPLFLFGAFWTPLPRAPQNSGPGVQVTCLCHGQNACSACGLPAFLFSQVMFIYSAILEPSKAICLILLGVNCKQTLGLGSFLVIECKSPHCFAGQVLMIWNRSKLSGF